VYPLAQILSYLIQQADALSFFHDFEEHQLRGRRTGQVPMEREPKCCNSEFGPFQHVENETTVQGGRLVRRQRRAEPRIDLAWNRSLGEDY
jgi:hypothetical protein